MLISVYYFKKDSMIADIDEHFSQLPVVFLFRYGLIKYRNGRLKNEH